MTKARIIVEESRIEGEHPVASATRVASSTPQVVKGFG